MRKTNRGGGWVFQTLGIKIHQILFWFIALVILCSSAIAYRTIRNNITGNFVELAVQNITQRNRNVALYMQYMEETVKLLTTSSKVLDDLRKSTYSSTLNKQLDYVLLTNYNIRSFAIYDNYGHVYLSSNSGWPPSLDDLLKDAGAKERPSSALWWYRSENIPELPSTSTANGVFSYLAPVYDETGVTLGFILVNTQVDRIYDYYFNNVSSIFSHTNVYLVNTQGTYFAAPNNTSAYQPDVEAFQSMRDETYLLTPRNDLLTRYPLNDSTNSIAVSLHVDMAQQLLTLNIAYSLLVLLQLATTAFGAHLIARSILLPLSDLYTQMTNSGQPGKASGL